MNDKDVGLSEDILQFLINATSIEHHSLMSYFSTKEDKWLELNDLARQMRTKYLSIIVRKTDAELWCISKHLLSSVMALLEVGNRYYSDGKKEAAKTVYLDAAILFNILLRFNNIEGGRQ